MNDLNEFITIIKNQIDRITPETDIAFTRFKNPDDLKQSLLGELSELEKGNMDKLIVFYGHFLPTSTFQELSIQNGWTDEYIDISGRIDELYMRLKPVETQELNKIESFIKRIFNNVINKAST